MPQPFYARKTDLKVGIRKGETVYSPQVCYYGVITTKQVAVQIAQESSLTQADVIGVFERLAYFCQAHLGLGYKIKLDGIGVLCNELITGKSVESEKLVTTRLIKAIRPTLHPEYTIVNGSFRYALLPEKTELVKVNYANNHIDSEEGEIPESPEDNTEDTGGNPEGPDNGNEESNPL